VVASIIRVEPEELTADALGLADAQIPIAPPLAVPPAADPTSQGVSAVLDSHSGALTMVAEHSGALRAHGAAVLSLAAAALGNADEENAAMIAAVIGGTAKSSAPSVAALSVRPAPPGVLLPEMPTMTPPPMLPGEQLSVLIHRGEGSAALLDFADTWRAHAARLDDLAGQILARSAAIDEHWVDGAQRAGANTREHGAWLRASADQAHKIAGVATDVADEFGAAKRATPTPEEFDEAHSKYMNAQARRDPIGMAEGAQRYAALQGRAAEAAVNYHGGVSAATYRPGEPLQTAPAIARTGFQPLSDGVPGGFKLDGEGGEETDPYTGAKTHGPVAVTPMQPQFDPKTGVVEGGGRGGEGEGTGKPSEAPPATPPPFSPPTKINGLTQHGEDQAQTRGGGHGVNDGAMQDAVSHPVAPPKFKPDQYGGTYQYVGKDATVNLNENGQVTTTWANNHDGWRNP